MTTTTVSAPAPGPQLAPSPRTAPHRSILVVAVPTVVAAVLSTIGITSRSLGFDEAASVTIAAQHGAALGHALAHDGGNMAGYYLLLHLLTGLFGNSLLVVRLPSVAFAAATAGLVTVLARKLFGARVALASGLLTAVSLPLVFWGQSARGYAPMVCLTCASFLAFVTVVQRSEEGRVSRPAALAYAIATALCAYTGFVAVLVIPAQLLMLARRRAAVRPVLYALGACVVSWIPLLVLALSRGSGQLFWVPRPTLRIERQVFETLASAGLQPSFYHNVTTVPLLVLTGVVLVAVAVALVLRAARGEATWAHGLVLSWLLVPVALAWVESLFGQPIFMPRNVLMAVPPAGVLLALGVTDRRVPLLAGGGVLAALLALRLVAVTASYGVSPEDWKGATAYVLERSRSSDCAVFYPSDGRMAFRYYLSNARTAPVPVLPATPWGTVKPFVEDYASISPARLTSCPRVWLISSHEGQADGPRGSLANRARYLRLRAAFAGLYPRHVTARFGYASTVRVELFSRR